MEMNSINRAEVKHFTNEKGEPYGHPWEQAVAAYLKSGNREKQQCRIEADGVTYEVLKRPAVTVFYDADGNTLFDVENVRLSEEAAGAGETGTGKKADTKQAEEPENTAPCASGREKLLAEEEEMLASVKPEFQQEMRAQMDLIFEELISWTEQDSEFEKKVLLDHKSMKRCMKFCADKAMGIRKPSDREKDAARRCGVPIMTPVRSDTLFKWIKEYYDEDDKAEAAREAKEAGTKEGRTGGKKAEGKKKAAPKENPLKKPAEKKEAAKETVPPQKGKSIDGQISMFDLFGA